MKSQKTATIINAVADPRLIADVLSPAQGTLLRAIYGLPLNEEQQGIFLRATGRTECVPHVYRDISVICGRRAGKSSRICTPIALYEACIASHVLPKGERGRILVVGPVEAQARITFRMILARLEKSQVLSKLIQSVRSGSNDAVIELTNGRDIQVIPANFRHIRGALEICTIFEEGAFYRDETGANPFQDVIAAVRPGLLTLPDSKLIRVSSPWSKAGVMWDDYRLRNERPGTLCWKLPSWEMNPGLPPDELERERQRDEAYFMREYGAEFLDAASALLEAELVEAAVVRGRPEFPPLDGHSYIGALDAAFKSDSFGFAASHKEGDFVLVDCVRSWKPRGPKNPVRFDVVLPQIIEIAKRYRIHTIHGDQVCSQPIREALERAGIKFVETTTLGRRAGPIYATLRAKVSAGQIRLPDVPELVSQLKRLELVIAPGGAERVEASSGHDDLAIAAALAVHSIVSRPAKRPWVERVNLNPEDDGRGWSRIN